MSIPLLYCVTYFLPHVVGQMAYFTHVVEHNFEFAANIYEEALAACPRNATLLYSAAVFHQACFANQKRAKMLLEQAFRSDPRRIKHILLDRMYYGRIVTFQIHNLCSQLHYAIFVEMVLRDFKKSRSIYRAMFDLTERKHSVDPHLLNLIKVNYKRLNDAIDLRKRSALRIQSFWRGLFSQVCSRPYIYITPTFTSRKAFVTYRPLVILLFRPSS